MRLSICSLRSRWLQLKTGRENWCSFHSVQHETNASIFRDRNNVPPSSKDWWHHEINKMFLRKTVSIQRMINKQFKITKMCLNELTASVSEAFRALVQGDLAGPFQSVCCSLIVPFLQKAPTRESWVKNVLLLWQRATQGNQRLNPTRIHALHKEKRAVP